MKKISNLQLYKPIRSFFMLYQGSYVQLSNIKNQIFQLKMITDENAFNFDFMKEFMDCLDILK